MPPGPDGDEWTEAFVTASINDSTQRAVRLLAATPQLAEFGLAPAVVLGDATRVRAALARHPELAHQTDPRSGWTPLHLACASRWHRIDPARANGLLAVARLLLDAGADATADVHGEWTPLRCAVAGVANPAIVALLLQRGARPHDHDVYLACFGDDAHESLRLLLDVAPTHAASAALAAPISTDDLDGVRLLLAAGADPNQLPPPDHDGGQYAEDPPCPAVYSAVRSGDSADLVRLLLEHGADPDAAGPDARSPYRLALRRGRDDLVELLSRSGATADATETDLFLAACLRGERSEALVDLTADDYATLHLAAATGHASAVGVMLDLGFPIEARHPEDGGTALHAAAYAGSAAGVQVLLGRGAALDPLDTIWNATPLVWAAIGSGECPVEDPDADWVATVTALLEAGASTAGLTLSEDDAKPPSAEVADLLRTHGVSDRPGG